MGASENQKEGGREGGREGGKKKRQAHVPIASHADDSDGLDGTILEEGELNVLQGQALHQAREDRLQALVKRAGGEDGLLGASHLWGRGRGVSAFVADFSLRWVLILFG